MFASCQDASVLLGKIDVRVKGNNKKPSIESVKVQNDQLIVSGNFLDTVTKAEIQGHQFQIASKTSEKLVLNASSAFNFLVGSALNLVVSNAEASATFPLSFELQNGQVTANKLHHMGASTGDFLQFNGSTWAPASISTNQVYVGTYNATTDTPNLSGAVASAGTYYIVTTAGTQDLGTGPTNFAVGDWVISDGTNWSKVSVGTNTVSNFNGRTGVVVPLSGDYSWSMLTKAAGKLTGSKLQEIADVDVAGIQDQDILQWNASNSKWEVTSVPAPTIGAGTISNTQIASGAIDSSKIIDGSIVNADISATAAIDQSKISNLTTDLGNKEPKITAGTVSQYWSGNKTWQDLNTAVIGSTLTGYSASAGAITAADSVLSAINKLSGNIGLVGASQANYVLKAGDTMSGALAMGGNKITGLATPTAGTDAATMAYVDSKVGAAPGDNLGNHTATQNLSLGTNKIFAGDGAWNSPSISFTNNSNTGFSNNGGIIRITANGGLAVTLSDSLMQLNGSFAPYLRLGGGTFGASGPTYAFNGDTDTGMFNISSDILAFTTGGAEKMRILGTGEMLIGKTTTAAGKLDVAGDIASEGKLRLKSDNTNYVEFRAPASLAATTTYTFPATAGSAGQALTTDGAGNLSWSAVADGTPADGSIGYAKLNLADGDIPLSKLAGSSDATKYLKGDKSWGTFITDVLASTFATVTPSNSAIANGDSLQTVVNKTQGQINNLASNSLNKTGTDSITGTLTINATTGALKIPATPSGVDLTDAANVQYVQNYVSNYGQWNKNASDIYFNTGKVGIGTNTPTGRFELQINTDNSGVTDPGSFDGIHISNANSTPNSAVGLRFYSQISGGATAGIVGRGTASDSMDMEFWTEAPGTTSRTNKMILKSDGKLGIGTMTPESKLHVAGTDFAGSTVYASRFDNTQTGPSHWGLKSRGATVGVYAPVLTNDILTSFGAGGYFGTTVNDSATAGHLSFAAESNWSSGNTPARAQITLNKGNNSYTTPFAVTSAGYVGVGTLAPTSQLEINSTNYSFLNITTTDSTKYSAMRLFTQRNDATETMGSANPTGNNRGWELAGNGTGHTLNSKFTMNYWDGTAWSTPFTIIPSGNVGIGTASPIGKMHIQGSVDGDVGSYLLNSDDTGTTSRSIFLLGTVASGVRYGYLSHQGAGYTANGALKPRTTVLTGTDSGGLNLLTNQQMGFWQGLTEIMRIHTNGNVGIGTAAPSYKLHVVGDINTTTGLRVNGTQVCTSAGCTSSSDRRLKKDIHPLQDSLLKITQLQGVEYFYIDEAKYGKQHQVGVIAQDVEKVFPEVVKTDSKTGFKSVAYDHLVAPIIEAIKELFGMTKENSREIASLKEKNKKLEEENAAIKAYLCQKDPAAPICN
ncbi:tail fiber domain-containing protein [Peredibacter starrii]|uniref:Tail fiber domain-containing protein n=1 Tax=Peredibacter starrii TaxID=28202 RepID=A0AAX4HNR7_9BACT|nr:tail fiber domain-containing protein [Peredibacter starrii]WPU64941.1 tail fiber domain-containing protein [Peredibacter starrii]